MLELEVKWHCFVKRVALQRRLSPRSDLAGEAVPHLPVHGIGQLPVLENQPCIRKPIFLGSEGHAVVECVAGGGGRYCRMKTNTS